MRMTARMFGVLCAASLVFCAACDGIGNKDEDEDNPVVTVSYDVGTIVGFNGKDYLVTKNSEGAVTTELTAVQTTDLGTYYPNERADAYRKKLLADYGVTAYVELFDITEGKEISPSSGDSALYDTYIILHGGKGIYKIRQRRIAKDLFSGDDAESRSQPFKAKTNDELRQNYDPNLINITNTLFETNLAKKFQEEYNFIYAGDKDADKQRLAYSDSELDYVFKRLNYAKINGSERNVYGFRERNAVAGKRVNGERCWELNHLNANSRFFEFNIIADGSYRLSAYGEGTVDGSASDTVYKGTLTIKGVQYDSSGKLDLRYDVGIKKNGSTISKSILPEGFDDNFVIKSSRMVSVEGVNFNVHETITFFVPFFNDNFVVNHNAVLNKYTKVTFVPKTENGGVIYVPKTDTAYPYEFIAQFMKDYQTVFGKKQPDVELQPDIDVDTDTTTPRFMFTGDSLRIELEEMKHNFVLSEEPAASGGKSGKLVDESSRAEAIITFPAGTYSGYAVIRAPSGDNDAFYVKFGDNYIRMYADDPLPEGYARTSRTPINLSCSNEVTVRMAILKDSPDKSGETGMYIDYVEFTKTGSQAGQGDSDTSEPGAGKADWTGFIMVDSADELDFKAGTYEMKCASFEEYQGKTKFDTMIYDVEIIANTAVLREKSRIRVYSNQEDYDVKKASVKDIDGYSWEDSTRTITRTYSDVSDESMPLSEFKEEFFSFPEDAVEDDYSRTHTDKKLGRKNGVIQASCTETIRKTEVERTEKYYYTITLTPQK